MILTKKTRKKRRSWPRKIEIKHDLDQEKKKVNEISTKKKSKFQDLPFFFYKFPPLFLNYHILKFECCLVLAKKI